MKIFIIIAYFNIITLNLLFSQKLKTYFELSNFKRTPRYDSTMLFCQELEKKSKFVHLTSIGKSHEGREIPLLIIASGKEFTPDKAKKSSKNIVIIQACIHAGEPDGKDAGFLLIRDILENKKMNKILNDNIILFIPILNVDGHERFSPYNRINQNGPIEMGWRANTRNLNLNRDYIKAQSIEIQNFLIFFHKWKPHFFIDCHTTNGADYQYPITYAMEIYGNMDSCITKWQKNNFLPQLYSKMDSANYPMFRYVAFRNWFDFESGLSAWITPPSLSQGYSALVNCPCLLIETHMLKDYKTRVFATYEMLKNTLLILSKEKEEIQKLTRKINFINKYTVAYKVANDSTMVEFKGMEYQVTTSDLTGGKWYIYSNKPKNHLLPLFDNFIPSKTINIPKYYVIPLGWADFFIHYFHLHNIFYRSLNKDSIVKAVFYKFSNVKLANTPYESCQRVLSYTIDTFFTTYILKKGSLIVPTNQFNYKILVHLIEPEAPASLFAYGFFNSIFEQKEYSEPYVMEPLARKMLENMQIKEQFNEFKQKNPNASSYEILNWFYNKSEYADPWLNVYPIGKIFD